MIYFDELDIKGFPLVNTLAKAASLSAGILPEAHVSFFLIFDCSTPKMSECF